MEENTRHEVEFDLWELLAALKEKLPVIIAVTLVAALLGLAVSVFLITPQYEASVNMIVNSRTDSTSTVTSDNITSAQHLVDTYAIIIKSNTVLNQVIGELNLNLTYDELYKQVSVNGINNTQVMKIAVLDSNPALAKSIVDTIARITPDIVKEAVDAGSCKVVSQVAVTTDPVSPDVRQNTIIAGLLGLVICVAVIVLKELLNDYIVDDYDVQRHLNIPVLGVIPDVEEK